MTETKKKILMVAAKEFADRGYNGATIRCICNRATVNVASINYHFKNKESLYKEVFEFLFSETAGEDIFSAQWDCTFAGWKAMIRKWVEKIVIDITQENPMNQCKWRIFGREMQDQSKIFPNIYENLIKPRLSNLVAHFRKVLPPKTCEDDIYIRAFSVIASCIFYFHDRVLVNIAFPERKFISENQDKIIDHIANIACIGISYEKQGEYGK